MAPNDNPAIQAKAYPFVLSPAQVAAAQRGATVIDPNDETTLPPLDECVVLIDSKGRKTLGGREFLQGDSTWRWVEHANEACPEHCKKYGWELFYGRVLRPAGQPIAWHPIGGEA